jgi:hypothetical protein
VPENYLASLQLPRVPEEEFEFPPRAAASNNGFSHPLVACVTALKQQWSGFIDEKQ